jgi:hypothetical protein
VYDASFTFVFPINQQPLPDLLRLPKKMKVFLSEAVPISAVAIKFPVYFFCSILSDVNGYCNRAMI